MGALGVSAVGLESEKPQEPAAAGRAGDGADRIVGDTGDIQSRLLPEMTEQVPSKYISLARSGGSSLEFSDIFPGDKKPATAGEPAVEPRSQKQIADACWANIEQAQKPNDIKIDGSTRTQVIDKLLTELQGRYVNPELLGKAGELLRSNEKSKYATMDSAEQFTKALNEDLRSVFNDKHLNVFFDEKTLPADFSKSIPETMDLQLKQQICERSGVESLKTLDGNIGYLQLTGFFPSNSNADPRAVELTKGAIDQAMAKLADKDALIIDLRDNTGGDPHTVLRVLNHLLEPGTNVNNIHWREGASTRIEAMVTEDPKQPKFGSEKPLYLLTSKETFSAGEEFAYDLKALGRATIIGGVTGGGANPTYAFRLTDNFGVAIPTGQSINPVTGKNWEGTGVKPDIDAPPEQALDLAIAAIHRKLGR